MQVGDLIARKRDGGALAPDEIEFLVRGYTAGEIPDYQMAAFLMAVCCRGMTMAETNALTSAMAYSGATLDLREVAPVVADKHSTGGVGDGITLVLAPLVAACGVPVGKLTGRGLGFTGGTVDKLEAIPGLRTAMDAGQFKRQLREVGLVIAGQSADLVPADGKIYALRDVTATVPSIPLIASSIMSKKIAGGATAIVLDVKVGRGAFMKTVASARQLAKTMVGIAAASGRRASAVLSSMDQPLGTAVGNALEVRQTLELLRGAGPADLRDLALFLASELLVLAGHSPTAPAARAAAESAITSGTALEKLGQMIRAQGGDAEVLANPALLPQAPSVWPVKAARRGYVQRLDALAVGQAAAILGAGRARKGDPVDPAVGVILEAKVGDRVAQGQPLAFLHTRGERGHAEAERLMQQAYQIGHVPPGERSLALEIIRSDGNQRLAATRGELS